MFNRRLQYMLMDHPICEILHMIHQSSRRARFNQVDMCVPESQTGLVPLKSPNFPVRFAL